MAIKYKVHPRKNPQRAMAPKTFYVGSTANGIANLNRLATLLSYFYTLAKTYFCAVLLALEHNIGGKLCQERIAELGRLDNFCLSFGASRNAVAANVSAMSIIMTRRILHSEKKLGFKLNEFSFKKTG